MVLKGGAFMYMLTHFSLTPGTILFLTGLAVTAAAIILAIVTAATNARGKQAIQERMKEKY